MRKLTTSIRTVISDIRSFGVMFFYFLLAFTQMFYFTKFFVTAENGQEWHWYLLYTFNAFFANWDYSTPTDTGLVWTQFIFMFFTFLFPIIMFNVLISMVCSSYADCQDNLLNEDNKVQLLLTRECIEIKKIYIRILGLFGYQAYKTSEKSYIYVCIEKLDKEVVDDSVIEALIMSKVRKLPEIEIQVNKIGTLNSKVFKLSQRVDSALTQMNGVMKKAAKEIEESENNLRKEKEAYIREQLEEQIQKLKEEKEEE